MHRGTGTNRLSAGTSLSACAPRGRWVPYLAASGNAPPVEGTREQK